MLILSPRRNKPEFSHMDTTLHGVTSAAASGAGDGMVVLEMTPSQKPSSYHISHSCYMQILRKEIAWLELEIMRLERHLIFLYENAYHQLQSPPHPLTSNGSSRIDSAASLPPPNFRVDGQQLKLLPYIVKDQDQEKENVVNRNCVGHNQNLADHCGSSSCSTPDRLSENIVKCISCIYYKLANPISNNHTEIKIKARPSLSCASSSNFSSSSSTRFSGIFDVNEENWSPPCRERRPYYAAIQVSNISWVDNDDTFSYVAKMLEKFRSLVKSLEKVNPGKMNREEKLAFWINIHNALIMHAHLAYGTQDHVKSNLLLKATYNVGGHCINAHIIQSSILRVRSHCSLPWVQTLISPRNKFKTESLKHEYAIEYAEPLVHFALCSGVYSDPAIRAYRAKNVFNDLKLAMEEFARASIYVLKETKVALPKIFRYFAKDMSLDVSALLKVVCECLHEEEKEGVAKCLHNRRTPQDKYIHWSPQSSTFRYIIHRQLAQDIHSI